MLGAGRSRYNFELNSLLKIKMDESKAVEAMRKRRETRKFVFTKSMLRRINDQLQNEDEDDEEEEDGDEDEDEKNEELASEPSEPPTCTMPANHARKLNNQVSLIYDA